MPEPLRLFLDEFFSPAEKADPEINGLLKDPDGDERSKLFEFKLGTDPRDARDEKQDVELSTVQFDGEIFTQMSYI